MKKISIIIVTLSALLSIAFYPILPNLVPMHWNALGQVDNYSNKSWASVFFPLMILGMFILFRVLPRFDPKKEKYKLFMHEWNIIQVGLLGFFLYTQVIVFYITLNPATSIMPSMYIGLGLLFIVIGNYLSKIRQNYFIGIRIPWTISDEDNWNKTHRLGSKCFVAAGIITLIEAFIPFKAPAIIFGSLILAAVVPMIYSFLLFKNAADEMKYIYLVIILLATALFLTRSLAGEDDWICANGQWVKHGNPSTSQPIEICK